jgi:hypothetical protein
VIDDKAAVCVGCGNSVSSFSKAGNDSDSVGWWWLGFFFPMIGFILWCVWTDNSPMKAKRVGWGSLIGVIASIALVVLFYLAMFALTFILAFLAA